MYWRLCIWHGSFRYRSDGRIGFGTVLFAIAAMVVLALIPLYLETKSTSANAYR